MELPKETLEYLRSWFFDLKNLNNISNETLTELVDTLNAVGPFIFTFGYDSELEFVTLFVSKRKEWKPFAFEDRGIIVDGKIVGIKGESGLESSLCIGFEIKQVRRELGIDEIIDK